MTGEGKGTGVLYLKKAGNRWFLIYLEDRRESKEIGSFYEYRKTCEDIQISYPVICRKGRTP